MKLLTLLIFLNAPDGSQAIQGRIDNLTDAECLPMQATVWRAAEESPVVLIDELGPLHQLDAACVYEVEE